jgi:predicted TIM-barrel fold metal-dependent hydrolase
MATTGIVDSCVQQWSTNLSEMKDLVDEKWYRRLNVKSKIHDPMAGSLMPNGPLYNAFWNEDSPDYGRPDSGEYTNSDLYSTPDLLEAYLQDQGVETAILTGHELRYITSLPNTDYQANIASAYNELLRRDWVEPSDIMKGAFLITPDDPEQAVEEIEKFADHDDFVTALVYGGGKFLLGHKYLNPIYEAAEKHDLTLTIQTSGNPTYRQVVGGVPEHHVEFDANLVQNHMTNLINMVLQGVFERHPDLKVVWAGEGVAWLLQTMWRSTRYYRNETASDIDLAREPHEYVEDCCYATTYSMNYLGDDGLSDIYEMFGFDKVIYGSGFPFWNHDEPDDLPPLSEHETAKITRENAGQVYDL